jgi:predicted DNA-binding protein (UPF0251 family)
MKWRKKIPRCVQFNPDDLACSCRWPLGVDPDILEQQEKIILTQAELQSLIDKDIDNKTMDEACITMEVSKTVYAGIYASARRKVTSAMMSWRPLTIECHDEE